LDALAFPDNLKGENHLVRSRRRWKMIVKWILKKDVHPSSAEVMYEWSCTSTPRMRVHRVDVTLRYVYRHVKYVPFSENGLVEVFYETR
jgi:hypothetical protein